MLSRVFKDSEIDTSPLVWRRGSNLSAPAPRTPPPVPAAAPGELTQLRATISQLTAQMEQQSRDAFDAGLRAGEAAATERLAAEVRETVRNLAASISEVASLRAETIHRAEVDTVRLAVEIARRVLHRELTVDTSALDALIKAALEKLQSQEVYRVRVHPDQAKIVRTLSGRDGTQPGNRSDRRLLRNPKAELCSISAGARWTPRWRRNFARSSAA